MEGPFLNMEIQLLMDVLDARCAAPDPKHWDLNRQEVSTINTAGAFDMCRASLGLRSIKSNPITPITCTRGQRTPRAHSPFPQIVVCAALGAGGPSDLERVWHFAASKTANPQ
jgi:hypothetical protein